MSAESESALTPEEWARREITNGQGYDTGVNDSGLMSLDVECDGSYFSIDIPPLKTMALANLALTLQTDPAAITQRHVDVCTSAGWYFRQLRRKAELAAKCLAGDALDQCMAQQRALEDGNKLVLELSRILRALVPQ